MKSKYNRLKFACYSGNVSMAVVGNLPPILFMSFRSLYGIPYSLLGLLVLINFCTQLGIDLVFSFFSHKFNISKTLKFMPVLTLTGFLIYAIYPTLFPTTAYLGLVIGTMLFAVSAGLAEVLLSPIMATIPAENPEREMSKLHSVYAWGVVAVVVISTVFLAIFGSEQWHWLVLAFTIIPIVSLLLFSKAEIPTIETAQKSSGTVSFLKQGTLWIYLITVFLGGSSECTMAQWSSGYLEQALGIPKIWGDVFGVALFSVMLGLGRSLYAKYGRNLEKVLLLCAIGSTICYATAAISDIALIGLIACIFTGFCTSMLWPGNIVLAAERFPTAGVFIYAIMAAGGDFGAAVGPQLVGIVTDLTISNSFASSLATSVGLTTEQLGMKLGILVGALFPLISIFFYLRIRKTKKL